MVIFVMAWCCIFATFLSRKTLHTIYFPNCHRTLRSYFFPKEIYWNCYRKILCDNWKPNRTLSIIFVLKLRFRENPLWNENLKQNFAWKYALRDNPNFADKLSAEITFSGKYVVKLKPETKRCVKIYFARQSELCRKTLRWFF